MAYDTTRLLTVGHARQVYENLAEQIDRKADLNGTYDELTVGSANQLVSNVGTLNNSPYVFRPTGDSNDVGDRKSVKKLIGGTLMWNQLLEHGNFDSTTGFVTYGGSLTVNDLHEGSFHVNSTSESKCGIEIGGLSIPANHVLLVSVEWQLPQGVVHDLVIEARASGSSIGKTFTNTTSLSYQRFACFLRNTNVVTGIFVGMNYSTVSGSYSGKYDAVRRFMTFDLTQMFGSEVADYLYESNDVDKFVKVFPNTYYTYTPGEGMSVNPQIHKTIGFNAWDEQWEAGGLDSSTGDPIVSSNGIRSKNFIPVLPNTKYYFNTAGKQIIICLYDANQAYLYKYMHLTNNTYVMPSNCRYIRIATTTDYGSVYHDDICVNISWDGERDGEYEPYTEHQYPLDSSVILLGIPKLAYDGSVYYDGDIYEPDGTITRRYGFVVLQGSEEWTKVTSGSNVCFCTSIDNLIHPSTLDYTGLIWCDRLSTVVNRLRLTEYDQFGITGNLDELYVRPNDTITEVAALETWLGNNPLTVVYELDEPYEEYATPYYEVQVVDNFGTEQFLDSRPVQIPVGHETVYLSNLRAKLEAAPNSPSGDGNYVVQKANGTSSYVPLSSALSGTTSRITALEGETVAVEGTTPSVTCIANGRYTCGTVTSISITPCAQGVCEVIFTSGSTPATLTIPSTVKFPQWFNKASLESNTIYEISILDGFLATVGVWPNT